MKQTKSLQSLLRNFWLLGALLSLLFPAVASAQSSKSVGNPEIIAQLVIVKATLADLKTQLQTVENRLISEIESAENRLNAKLDAQGDDLNAKLDAQGIDLGFLVADAESQEKDITISKTLCFSVAAAKALEIGGHAEAGVGWPNVLDAKLVIQLDGKTGFELGLSDQICIDVPLHKIASAPLAEFNNTQDFDDLIAAIVAPSQAVIPLVATVYTAIMPSQEQAMQAMGNVIEAATGFDINSGAQGTPNPQLLLRPDLLFEPVIGPYLDFINGIPTAVATIVTDPCQALEDSPLQIDTSGLGILCNIGPDFVVHIGFNAIDPLHLFTHATTCVFPDFCL